MKCAYPFRIYPKKKSPASLVPSDYPEGLLVPCGKCVLCRKAKRREWAMRVLHELSSYDDACFITLTYSDEFVPPNGSLVVSDLQKFFKRLRRRLSCEDRKIRYFAAGEYGTKTQRPHYHAIVFGLSLREEDKSKVVESWPLCDWLVPQIFKGSFGIAEPASIEYVAQYVDKIGNDLNQELLYVSSGRVPPFGLRSLGLGREFIDRNAVDIVAAGAITVGGKRIALPRYYINRLGIDVADLMSVGVDLDMDVVAHYTGISDLTDDLAYRALSSQEYAKLNDRRNAAREQSVANELSRIGLRQSKI